MINRFEMNDVIVVLPGILGSALATNGRPVWGSAGSIIEAVTRFGGSLDDLRLPRDIGDAHPGDGVEATSLLADLHLIPGLWDANIGYDRLLDWLRVHFHTVEPDARDPTRMPNLIQFPYDWRLSNRYNARRLKQVVEPALERWRSQGGVFADAKLVFICHSMGGLVARWYIEMEQGAELTRKLFTLGTPFRGAAKSLEQLINGTGFLGPLGVDLTDFARSLPSAHQLLPEYACIESDDGLKKTTETSLPRLDPTMVEDAMAFHDDLDLAASRNTPHPYDLHPIVGYMQPTRTTARIVDERKVTLIDTIDGREVGGDGTVPSLAAVPRNLKLTNSSIRRIPDQHVALTGNRAVLDELLGALSVTDVDYRAGTRKPVGVRADSLIPKGQRPSVEATLMEGEHIPLLVSLFDERGKELRRHRTPLGRPCSGHCRVELAPINRAGAYLIRVGGIGRGAAEVATVTSSLLVWE